MTKRNPAKHYTEKPITDWTVRDFHAYLTDENARRFGVTYSPFGKGTKGQRWGFEQGSLRQAIDTYGPAVVRRFIDECFAEYRSTADYPCMTWGFVYAYRERGLQRAQVAVAKQEARSERQVAQADVDYDELRRLL